MKTKTFRLHWLDGSIEEIRGPTISLAFVSSGYSAGALRALDYWEEVK